MSASPEFSVKVSTTAEDKAECQRVRIEVFVDEQGFSKEDELDEIDATGAHVSFLVCNAEGKAVGTVRLVALPTKVKLTRLAIEKDYRKYGLGRVLVRALEEFVANNSTREDFAPHVKEVDGKKVITVKIHSQIPVIKFYGKLGYVEVGERFDEDGEPHQAMVQDIEVVA